MTNPFIPGPDPEVRKSGHSLNKYSSSEEVKTYNEGFDIRVALRSHIVRFYPDEPLATKLEIPTLERILRTLTTKAMETL